jgi:hypothetical protein
MSPRDKKRLVPTPTVVDERAPLSGHIAELMRAWNEKQETPFAVWVRSVSKTYYEIRLNLEGAARLLATNVAELQAVLNLATMDDADLELLSSAVPPKTTWFVFAGASSEGVQAGLDALKALGDDASPFQVVYEAVRSVSGPDVSDRVAALPGAVLGHMARKAKQYDLLSPRSRKFLVDIARRKGSGTPLSPRQVAYSVNVLTELVEHGAVSRPSPDDDQEHCNAVLDALGL